MRILLLSATLVSATLAATALTSVAALADDAAGNKLIAQAGSSTATITQSGKNGSTTTTTRSTDGSQTIKRENGNSSATIKQSSAGSASIRQESGRTAASSPNVPIPTSREEAKASPSCAEPTGKSTGSKTGTTPKTGTEKTVKSTAASGTSSVKPDCFEGPSTGAEATTTRRHDTEPRQEAEVTTTHNSRKTPVEQDIKAKFGFDLEPSSAFKNNFLKKVP